MYVTKFLVQSLFNPSIFFAYLFLFAQGSFGSKSLSVFGIVAFRHVDTNIYAVNLILFIPFALLAYAALVFLSYLIILAVKKGLTFEHYKTKRLTWWYCIPYAIGGFNLLIWIFGMEGNVFVLFALLMLIAILVQLIQWLWQSWELIRSKTTG